MLSTRVSEKSGRLNEKSVLNMRRYEIQRPFLQQERWRELKV
jgi:hypothetical protein